MASLVERSQVQLAQNGERASISHRHRLHPIYLPALAFGALTCWVVFVAVTALLRDGQLGRVLAAGRAELAAPALAALVCATLVSERLWPAEPRRALARGHVQDACFLVLYAAAVVPLMTLLGVGFATLVGEHMRWIELSFTGHLPTWLLLAVALVAMDGANWVAHYADHRLQLLWRFHALHHSQEELSVLTSFRAHPVMHTTGFLLATLPVVALMGDRPMVPVLITAYVCVGTLQHANVRWSFGLLGKVVVSPAYHRLHHSLEATRTVNLGIALTLWDVLARCAQFPLPSDAACPTGLAGRPLAVEQAGRRARPLSFLAGQLLEPFATGRR